LNTREARRKVRGSQKLSMLAKKRLDSPRWGALLG
jgi:hypothetical protein